MEFYDGLLNELSKFNEFVDRAKDDDLSLATVYGMEKSKFILYAMSQQDNKKLILKLLDGCIQKEIWGFLSFMLVDCSSYKGVDTFITKNIGYISKMVNSRNRINEKIIFLHVSNTEEICDLMHSFLD